MTSSTGKKAIVNPRQTFHHDGKDFVTGNRRDDYVCQLWDIVRFKVHKKTDGQAHPNFGRIVEISPKGFATIVVNYEDDLNDPIRFIRRKVCNLTWIASSEKLFAKAEVDLLPFVDIDKVLEAAGAKPINFN